VPPFRPPSLPWQKLTAADAAAIFALNQMRGEDGGKHLPPQQQKEIATKYGVTNKTIRGEHAPRVPRLTLSRAAQRQERDGALKDVTSFDRRHLGAENMVHGDTAPVAAKGGAPHQLLSDPRAGRFKEA